MPKYNTKYSIKSSRYKEKASKAFKDHSYVHENNAQKVTSLKLHVPAMKYGDPRLIFMLTLMTSAAIIGQTTQADAAESPNNSVHKKEATLNLTANNSTSTIIPAHVDSVSVPTNIANIDYSSQNPQYFLQNEETLDCSQRVARTKLTKLYNCIRALPDEKKVDFLPKCNQLIPDSANHLESIESFYSKVKALGGGGTNAVINVIRDLDNIALRVTPCTGSGFEATMPIQAYAMVASLKGQEICDYYPEIYRIYYGPKNGLFKLAMYQYADRFLYTEMELVNPEPMGRTYDKYPDSIVFESFLGKWATVKIAKISIHDAKGRHYVTKDADYFRAYHIGSDRDHIDSDHIIYLLPPGKIPQRIDLDIYTMLKAKPTPYPIFSAKIEGFIDNCQTSNGNAVAKALEKGGNIFDIFSKHFASYKVSASHLLSIKNIKHFSFQKNIR